MGNWFKYNGISSDKFGIKIEQKRVLDTPDYDREFRALPGRDGDIIVPNKRYTNVLVSYTCFLNYKGFSISERDVTKSRLLALIKGWLFSSNDKYAELEDSYDTETYRLATISTSISIDEQLNKLGYFTVMFTCKPFKYLNNGKIFTRICEKSSVEAVANNQTIIAYPLIEVTATDSFQLTCEIDGGYTWQISNSKSYSDTFYIDCENKRVYDKYNALITKFTYSGTFPYLPPASMLIRDEKVNIDTSSCRFTKSDNISLLRIKTNLRCL